MKIDADVMAVLGLAVATPDGIKLQGQIDRALYLRVDKVLKATGWIWNGKSKVHRHQTESAADALDSLQATGEVLTQRELGFFETPDPIVARLIELANIQFSHLVLEPSAGRGSIVRGLLATGALVHAHELQAEHAGALAGLLPPHAIQVGDFLSRHPDPIYDRVVMNPPFARQQDLAHVFHASKFLRHGGRLWAVMSSGAMDRGGNQAEQFRSRIAALSPQWERLPERSFQASGTMVNTVILTLVRP